MFHIGWIFLLYAWLTFARKRAVKRGETQDSCFVLGRDEPLFVARITRNLANQFELPVLFYFLVIVLIIFHQVKHIDIVAGWLFLIGRIIHTYVQTRTDNVTLRGQVFLINFIAVVILAAHVVMMLVEQTL